MPPRTPLPEFTKRTAFFCAPQTYDQLQREFFCNVRKDHALEWNGSKSTGKPRYREVGQQKTAFRVTEVFRNADPLVKPNQLFIVFEHRLGEAPGEFTVNFFDIQLFVKNVPITTSSSGLTCECVANPERRRIGNFEIETWLLQDDVLKFNSSCVMCPTDEGNCALFENCLARELVFTRDFYENKNHDIALNTINRQRSKDDAALISTTLEERHGRLAPAANKHYANIPPQVQLLGGFSPSEATFDGVKVVLSRDFIQS